MLLLLGTPSERAVEPVISCAKAVKPEDDVGHSFDANTESRFVMHQKGFSLSLADLRESCKKAEIDLKSGGWLLSVSSTGEFAAPEK